MMMTNRLTKKIACVLAGAFCLLALAGCGGNDAKKEAGKLGETAKSWW